MPTLYPKLRAPIATGLFAVALGACASAGDRVAFAQDRHTTLIEAASREDGARPNIVLVLFEDMSTRVGAFGDDLASTPNFDRIAAEGVRYTHVFTAAGVCAPSRASLITGRHQMTIGAQHMRTASGPGFPVRGPQNYLAVPPENVKAFPELLRASGYYTSNNAKTDYQFGEPFTIWDESSNSADWTGRDEGQPFFHMQTIMTTHESALWSSESAADHPLGPMILKYTQPVREMRVSRTDPASVTVPPYYPDTPEVRRDIATLYDNIALADRELAALYSKLEADGVLENTVLIVSTDHGDGLPRAKRSLYDSGLRVPMVIRFPDKWRAGEVDDQMISFVDLAPTILSWAETSKPNWVHGLDFDGEDRDPEREYIFAAQDRTDEDSSRRRAVRDRRYKLIRNFVDGDPYFEHILFRDGLLTMQALHEGHASGTLPPAAEALYQPLPEVQLYDTAADPHEVRNIHATPDANATQARLEKALSEWMSRVGDMSEMTEAEMIEQMWPGGDQPHTAAPVIAVADDGERSIVTLSSETPGASLGYQLGEEQGDWALYTGPFAVGDGQDVRAKGIRYGFKESDVSIWRAAGE